jgi:hypothetical protein
MAPDIGLLEHSLPVQELFQVKHETIYMAWMEVYLQHTYEISGIMEPYRDIIQ